MATPRQRSRNPRAEGGSMRSPVSARSSHEATRSFSGSRSGSGSQRRSAHPPNAAMAASLAPRHSHAHRARRVGDRYWPAGQRRAVAHRQPPQRGRQPAARPRRQRRAAGDRQLHHAQVVGQRAQRRTVREVECVNFQSLRQRLQVHAPRQVERLPHAQVIWQCD